MSLFTKKVGLCAALFLGAQCALARTKRVQKSRFSGHALRRVCRDGGHCSGSDYWRRNCCFRLTRPTSSRVPQGKFSSPYTQRHNWTARTFGCRRVPPAPAETSFGAGPSVVLADNQSAKIQLLAPAGCDAQWQGCQNTPAPIPIRDASSRFMSPIKR